MLDGGFALGTRVSNLEQRTDNDSLRRYTSAASILQIDRFARLGIYYLLNIESEQCF
jgi:hypothetical protein